MGPLCSRGTAPREVVASGAANRKGLRGLVSTTRCGCGEERSVSPDYSSGRFVLETRCRVSHDRVQVRTYVRVGTQITVIGTLLEHSKPLRVGLPLSVSLGVRAVTGRGPGVHGTLTPVATCRRELVPCWKSLWSCSLVNLVPAGTPFASGGGSRGKSFP